MHWECFDQGALYLYIHLSKENAGDFFGVVITGKLSLPIAQKHKL